MAWPNDKTAVRERRRPWREKEAGRIRHGAGDGEELRIALVWVHRGDRPSIEFRQWDYRFAEPIPTRFGFRMDAKHIPWLIEKLTAAALETGSAEDFTIEEI